MPTTKRHIFNLNRLSPQEEEIIKRVNNPRVIQSFKNEWLNTLEEGTLENYVDEIVSFWKNKIANPNPTSENNSKLSIDFTLARKDVAKHLRSLDKKYCFPRKPSGAIFIKVLREKFQNGTLDSHTLFSLMDVLTTKNRHHSGVLEIAIMTSPGKFSCKYDCYYCPNQKDMPRSYVREEPAVRRGAQNDFDCVKQINARISSYLSIGQPGDKGEFIILGGTFSNYSDEYRYEFMRDLYYACNTFYDEVKRSRKTLEDEKLINETALFKVVGLTVETRPDCITPEEIARYIKYGVTRVQIGVQHTNDRLLKKINRQCYTKDTIRAMHLLKQSGFKILCHYMPNLPGATPDEDIEMFNQVIYNPDLIADEWKIYPTSVTTTSSKDIEDVNTVIEKWFIEGKYTPYDYNQLEEVIRHAKNHVPKYIRISRVFRDIPVDNIIGGADIPHMRQKVQRKMAEDGEFCRCIRCAEIKNREIDISKIKYNVDSYQAQNGTEYFISANYEDIHDFDKNKNKMYLVGFCRLRINQDEKDMPSNLKNAALVRELHVYGKMVPSYLSKILESNTQHKGIGSNLMKIAERIAMFNFKRKVAVISGVGVRGFYRNKLGYKNEKNYMVKYLLKEYAIKFTFEIIAYILVLTTIYAFGIFFKQNIL